ncbi:hypothetical protein JCM8208_000023 [Rhodotorula glutinis]
MPPAADHAPPAPSAPTPAPARSLGARHEFVSSDCSVRVRGRIVQHGPPGQIDGIQLELDQDEGLSIRYPQLVSVRIRPEEQTLWSINSGERLLTLATPLLPPSDDQADSDNNKHSSSSAIDDDEEDGEGEAAREDKATKPTVVTLHEGFLPASEADHLESSPLYSSTFQVLIDGPTFPPPHFDPASLAPPTPAVRPHDGGLSSGMLNSPTIQRALLSPLLSPQRRAASQGSDASVPPLSIGLSRTSRASFSAPDRPPLPTNPSTAASRGLAALIVPPPTASSSASTAAAPTLGGTLTGALSSAAKRTAEELVALRRAHDAYVRRAKAELEILEARIDNFDGHVAGKEEGIVRGFRTRDERDKVASRRVDAGGSVSRSRERERARGRTPVADVVEGGEAARRSSASGSRERPMSRGRGSVERASAPPAHGAASSSSSSSVPRATNKDEDVSSLIRAQDEREEDQRGRSRSRARRDEAGPPSTAAHGHGQHVGGASQRSRSRTKALAEANAKVLEGASASASGSASASASGSAVRQGDSTSRERGGEVGEAGSGSASASGESRGRGRGPRKGENIPATLEEEDEEDDEARGADRRGRDRNRDRDGNTTAPPGDPRGSNGLLSPSSAGAGQPTTRGGNGNGVGSSTGTTPTFHPAGHPLVAIPESEELSVTPSDKGDGPEQPAARSERLGERAQRDRQKSAEQDEEDDQPFEMDEDVDVDAFDLGSPLPRTVPLESPSLEVGNGSSYNQPQQSVVSSSFRPGSFQRASALSASYNALLATHSPKMRASPHSPAVGLPVSPSVSATRAYGSPASRASPAPRAAAGEPDSALPPFSPPEAHRQTATSAREDAQAALASSTLEHSRGGRTGGPDPRDVRRGEQKIRDVLAMDVPSHRPLHSTRRRASVDTPNAATYQADDDGTDSAESSEEDDVVPDLGGGGSSAAGLAMSGLTSPNSGGPRGAQQQQQQQQQHQVGSLPIALGRPSSVNAALSSWRPDPERDWAQARERKTSLAQGREQPLVPPVKGASSSSAAAASGARTIPTAGGGAAVLPVEPPSAPLEIESPATPRPTSAGGTGISGMPGTGASSGRGHDQAQGQGASVAMSSSLAQSLRNAPASFGRRAEAEGRNGALQPPQEQGQVDRGALSSGTAAAEGVTVADEEGNEDGEDGDEDDDDDGAFVPPHLVAERRERKDERWLSRSIGGSKRSRFYEHPLEHHIIATAANAHRVASLASERRPHLHRPFISRLELPPSHALTPQWRDFLTRDLTAQPRPTLAQPSSSSHPTPTSPTTSTSTASPSSSAATSPHADRRTSDAASLTPSSATGSTLEHNAVVEQTAARFSTLRTADPAPAPSSGVPGEPNVEPPSVAKGDWLAYSRVKAQVVLWPEGTVGVKGGKKLREREGDEEWVVDGQLWITKLGEIILVINQNKPPVHVDRSRARMASLGRRLSIGSFGRTTSRDSGGGGDATSATATDDDPHAAEGKGGFAGFVKKVVSAVSGKSSSSHGESGSGSGDGMSLTRTRTGERTPRTTTAGPTTTPPRRTSGDESAAGRGGLTFEEPEKAPSPFPTYKAHPVTALYIRSPTLIHSLRFYPHRKVQRSSFGSGSKDAPVSSAPGPAAPKDEHGKVPESDSALLVSAPIVELDLVDKDKGLEVVGQEGASREVTVGFVFKDVLLMNEADSFRRRVEALLRPPAAGADSSPQQPSGFGSALMRTISGKNVAAAPTTSSSTAPASTGEAPPPVAATAQPGDVEGETGAPVRPEGQTRRRSSLFGGLQKQDVWV